MMNKKDKKTCKRYGLEKEVSEFHRNKKLRSGFHSYCKICNSELNKENRNKNLTLEKQNEYAKKYRENNREKINAYYRQWAKENPNKIREKTRRSKQKLRENNPELLRKWSFHSRIRSYGITIKHYYKMHKEQEGCCAICGKKPKRSLNIDHNHLTRQIRGLLCMKCNFMIGNARDNPFILINGAKYLSNYKRKKGGDKKNAKN